MRLPILASMVMGSKVGEEALIERKAIRTPGDFRDFFSVNVGDFLDLITIGGNVISLSAEKAYKEDTETDSLSAYVTPEVHQLLFGNISAGYEVGLVDGITLGCDPELVLINRATNEIVSAAGFTNKWGPVGYDGLLLELRPLPSTSEHVVTDNLYELMLQARAALNRRRNGDNIMITAVSSFKRVSAGFHLHYGLPPELLGWGRKNIAALIVKALDYYLGIPSILPEGNADNFRRTVFWLSYGKPGDFRLDSRTLEYRVPGGSLMRHPILTKGLLALGAVVVEDIVSRIQHCTDSYTNLGSMATDCDIRELYPNMLSISGIFEAICNLDTAVALDHFNTVRGDVEKMVGYARRRTSIEEYFKCIDEKIDFSPDAESNWRRYYTDGQRQPKEMDILRSSDQTQA